MKRLAVAIGLTGAGLLLGSCATMSEDQCLAGAWGEVGYADGQAGYAMSRLDEHAEACAKYGVVPEVSVYQSARADGLLRYCTEARGFEVGRRGETYNGVCTPEQESEFLPAYEDGRVVHGAVQAAETARSTADGLASRLTDLDDKIRAKQDEVRQPGLTDDEREAIRDRIREIRVERETTERDWRRALSDLDDAEGWAREVRWRFEGRYGSW
jgi:hypothetical protein